MQPKTQYTKSDDVNVAYQVFGEGQFDLVFVYGFVSHLDFQWTDPAFTSLLRRLASFSRVIVFDKRGTGLSDPVGAAPTFDERMDDVRAVMDAVGCEQAALVGYSEGGVIAALFAATYPDRARALVLYETWVSGLLDVEENPGREKWLELDRKHRDAIEHWGEGRTLAWAAPSQAGSELTKRMFGAYERAALSPAMAGALWDAITNCDIRAVVPTIDVPTLVLAHRDSAIPVEHSRFLAGHIDGARLVELPGQDHAPAGGDVEGVADEMEEFLTGARRSASTGRVLATVMLTDIVGSTERGAALGDTAWKAVRERHDAMVRQQLPRFGGRELKQTGDGFLAVFDGPARAVDCAEAVREAIRELELELRIGIHTGECELIGDDITGMAVNIAARIGGLAGPSEILVSSTVRDLVVGSDLRFVDGGVHELKGVPGEWRVFRVLERSMVDSQTVSLLEREVELAILRQEQLGAAARPVAPVLGTRRRGALLMTAGGGAVLAAALAAGIIAFTDGGDEQADQSRGAAPLPAANCSPIVSTPGVTPRLLIAADLPLGATYRSLGTEMDAAIRYVLRGRGFRAGRHTVGYQACDESTRDGAVDDQGHCEHNARAYARLQSVIAVIGPFSSTCATFQIPITNRAGLAMLSPTNTYVGLTRGGAGAAPGEPDSLYPTGRRTYARVIPDDRFQMAANGLLARRLGVRRLFLLQGLAGAPLEAALDEVDYAATHAGVRVVGRDGWDSSAQDFSDLVGRIRRARADGVFLGGALNENEGLLIRELHEVLPRAQLLAPDGFSATDVLVDDAGSAAEGMTVTISGTSPSALGSRGREFVERLSDHLGVTPEPYSIYAAQAAEVMLDAIERSDGTRASVVRELFRTRVRDGIVGDFSLTPTGDTTARAVSVYRIEGGRQELFTVLTPGRDLVRGSAPAG